jgi:hypothetical protein
MSNIFNKKAFFSSNKIIKNITPDNYTTEDQYKGPIKYNPSSSKE